MSRGGQEYRLLNSSMDAMRQAAWDSFVFDYVNAVDPDPGEARTRYRDALARIDARQALQETSDAS